MHFRYDCARTRAGTVPHVPVGERFQHAVTPRTD
jgi:hypothetical protein